MGGLLTGALERPPGVCLLACRRAVGEQDHRNGQDGSKSKGNQRLTVEPCHKVNCGVPPNQSCNKPERGEEGGVAHGQVTPNRVVDDVRRCSPNDHVGRRRACGLGDHAKLEQQRGHQLSAAQPKKTSNEPNATCCGRSRNDVLLRPLDVAGDHGQTCLLALRLVALRPLRSHPEEADQHGVHGGEDDPVGGGALRGLLEADVAAREEDPKGEHERQVVQRHGRLARAHNVAQLCDVGADVFVVVAVAVGEQSLLLVFVDAVGLLARSLLVAVLAVVVVVVRVVPVVLALDAVELEALLEHAERGVRQQQLREHDQHVGRDHRVQQHAEVVAAQLRRQQQQRHHVVDEGAARARDVRVALPEVDDQLRDRVAHHRRVRHGDRLLDDEAGDEDVDRRVQPAAADAGHGGEDGAEEDGDAGDGVGLAEVGEQRLVQADELAGVVAVEELRVVHAVAAFVAVVLLAAQRQVLVVLLRVHKHVVAVDLFAACGADAQRKADEGEAQDMLCASRCHGCFLCLGSARQ
eukprot:Rhum_TRINITY_DN14805_c1_g1::Rhum_TRINITY_DN14805_c1_g1_i1::g.121426::m.121426